VSTTTTADRSRELQDHATESGHDHGWTHAAYVDACGGDPHAEPDVPARFATVDTFYTCAYADGVAAYFDDTDDH
jgi:hypothetical protein